MDNNQKYIYSLDTIESIIANPESSWQTLFKETIISMIATNKNDLLWYANFLSRCEYEFHFNESFVSSVYFNGKNFVIAINPLILGVIEKDQIIAILKHSAGHIVNHHFSRRSKDESVDKEIIEVAKDIVINGNRDVPYIKDLPSTGEYTKSPIQALFYQTLNEKYGIESYELGREFEYYVDLISKAQDENEEDETEDNATCENNMEFDSNEDNESDEDVDGNNPSSNNNDENIAQDDINIESDSLEEVDENRQSSGDTQNDSFDESNIQSDSLKEKTLEALNNGNTNIDSHEFGEQLQENVGLSDDLLESFMDTTLQEMINDSTSFARGFTPSEAMDAQNRIEKRKSHKDWKKIFNKKMRNFLSNSLRYREPNKSRQHPIYPDDLDLYGYSPGKKPKIAVVLDVSGSVNDKLLSSLMSEIQGVQKKYGIKTVTLVQVDAEIKGIEKFGIHDKFIIRHGGGGTIMEPGFSVLLKQQAREIPDIIICATDGDIEKEFEYIKIPSKVQVVWLVDKEGELLFDISRYPKQQMSLIEFSL